MVLDLWKAWSAVGPRAVSSSSTGLPWRLQTPALISPPGTFLPEPPALPRGKVAV
jgi:hypothetical protein